MLEKIARVINAYKRRMVKQLKRRSPLSRLKSRQYYKTHKSKIQIQRRRYMKRNNIFSKTRKLFKRTKPSWMSKKKQHQPHIVAKKPKKPPFHGVKKPKKWKPVKIKRPKVHALKRNN